MVFRIERHPMILFAASYGIFSNYRVGCRIDDGKHVLILQVEVDFERNWIVLWHPSSGRISRPP